MQELRETQTTAQDKKGGGVVDDDSRNGTIIFSTTRCRHPKMSRFGKKTLDHHSALL
jgi:hypothetical protein